MNTVTLEVYVVTETELAVLVNDSGNDEGGEWLPKSQIYGHIAIEQVCEFEIPEWLAIEKGFV